MADFTEAVSRVLALVSISESETKLIHEYKCTSMRHYTLTYMHRQTSMRHCTLTYMHRQVTVEVRHQSVHWLYSDQVLQ